MSWHIIAIFGIVACIIAGMRVEYPALRRSRCAITTATTATKDLPAAPRLADPGQDYDYQKIWDARQFPSTGPVEPRPVLSHSEIAMSVEAPSVVRKPNVHASEK